VLLQFHLRTLPSVLVYMAATSMGCVFGAGSLVLFGLWLATAKRGGKSIDAAAGPLSAELSDESEVDADAASGAQWNWILHMTTSSLDMECRPVWTIPAWTTMAGQARTP